MNNVQCFSINESERAKTKHVVYALMYGAGKQKLAEILDVNVDQAHNIINSFYTKFKQVNCFWDIFSEWKAKTLFIKSLEDNFI